MNLKPIRLAKKKLISKTKELLFSIKFDEKKLLNNSTREDDWHLEHVISWICNAQDITGCNGVSSHYDILTGKWGGPYRETTGYIIETFIEYYKVTKKIEFLKRAEKMADWEISVQCNDGSFGEVKKDGQIGKKVFNTGQIIIGLLSIHNETKEKKYLESALKAGNWLVDIQEPDGSWDRFTTQGKKTYHSRVAWPMMLLYKITTDEKYKKSAEKNIEWVLKQQQQNYWFDNCGLSLDNSPWTHLIAYTISGLLEYYLLLEEKKENIFNSFYNSSCVLLEIFNKEQEKYLECSFNKDWNSNDKYSCLTGDAQLAIIWLQIYKITNEHKFYEGAHRIIEQIKMTQIIDTNTTGIKGGIFGSHPIDGDYGAYKLINWASKFFADALIIKKQI